MMPRDLLRVGGSGIRLVGFAGALSLAFSGVRGLVVTTDNVSVVFGVDVSVLVVIFGDLGF
jgi:hypothetical protein